MGPVPAATRSCRVSSSLILHYFLQKMIFIKFWKVNLDVILDGRPA